MNPVCDTTDRAMMMRCIELSNMATGEGEYPFGTVIALDGRIAAEATNRTMRDCDVSRHAEVIALSAARKALTQDEMSRATLYSNVEPCAMCSYCIREAWVGRVVYALGSPIMGGASKWTILQDQDLSNRIPIFGPAPEIVSGFLQREAQQVWRAWSPLAWEMMRLRGVFSMPKAEAVEVNRIAAHPRSALQHLTMMFMRLGHLRTRRAQ